MWQWNRAIYDDAGDGHLRMEARALPAGPTAIDMVAGAALTLGLARGLRDRIARLLPALPFPLAEYNFYRAAQNGLDARLVWPSEKQHGLQELPLVEVLADLLPVADEGLRALGVTQAERDRYLGVIDTRLSTGRNPAAWQRQATRRALDSGCDKREALASMLERYIALSESNEAVAEWPL